MKLLLTVLALSTIISLPVLASPVEEGLGVLKDRAREELEWLRGLKQADVETFLTEHAPSTMQKLRFLSDKARKAGAKERTKLRQEMADLLAEGLAIYRRYLSLRKSAPNQAKTCLRLMALHDQVVKAEMTIEQLERMGALKREIMTHERKIESLMQQIDHLENALTDGE